MEFAMPRFGRKNFLGLFCSLLSLLFLEQSVAAPRRVGFPTINWGRLVLWRFRSRPEKACQRAGDLAVERKVPLVVESVYPCARKRLAWRERMELPFEEFPDDALCQMVLIEGSVYT